MDGLSPGFTAPVEDQQACFRAVLEATSRPGTIVTLAGPTRPPAPLGGAMAAVALTLVDADTPLWLDDAIMAGAAPSWLRFHCGCRLVADPSSAVFAFAADAAALPPLSRFFAGTDEYPDRGATIVVAVAALGEGHRLTLTGPGIAGTAMIATTGLQKGFAAMRAANHRLFPRGVDVILVAGNRLVSLPRSTTVSSPEG
ncbi:phosphonate C-P lyase system protein PhnH [Elioraea sp.]|uniref:phosphonate C-P lyase system protein PhnH n=1 Tax=Elioraea sp. TaxID=2185103 RepID=UPI0025B9B467|nr:phosphonate C-P lyase system protein PhnH [Elioraea sp.]